VKTPTNNVAHLFQRSWRGEPVVHGAHESEGQIIGRIVDAELRKSEEQYRWNQLGPKQREALLEPALLEKSKLVGRQESETLLSFYARTGLNPRQLREWKVDRLISFAAQTKANDEAQGIHEPKSQLTF
jgi:hypothetical protein